MFSTVKILAHCCKLDRVSKPHKFSLNFSEFSEVQLLEAVKLLMELRTPARILVGSIRFIIDPTYTEETFSKTDEAVT